MALRVTRTTDKVMFGPVVDWGKKSILVSGGRQYTLEECSRWARSEEHTSELQSVSFPKRFQVLRPL